MGGRVNPIERKEKSRELRSILEKMDVPSFRIQLMNETNLRWLQRNVGINNGAHPDIDRVMLLIRQILTQ